ncbi:MAG: hypothetical protein PHP92_03470 [Candidatus Nanoarchaeia archaeon]|nr:hypothetical protein [Candidatus Nanoarchaeia archaeon]
MGEPMDRSGRIFASRGTFDEVFPNFEDVIIDVTESGDGLFYPGIGSDNKSRKHSVKERGGLIGCSNPSCKQGGFEMDFIIHNMVRKNETTRIDSMFCAGWEGSKKLRYKHNKCMNKIDYKITIIYKEGYNEKTNK